VSERRRTPGRTLIAAAIALVAVAVPHASYSTPRAGACTRFAAPGGDDDGAGTERRPFRTVQRLADSLRAGETGCVAGGIYRAPASTGYVLRVNHGGDAGAPITIRSAPGVRATLVGIVYVLHGSDNVTLSTLTIIGTGGQNTVQIMAGDVIVEDSDITNAWKGNSCMILGDSSGYGKAVRPIVRRNRVHECGLLAHVNRDHGIYVNNTLDGRIIGNVFWNLRGYAIHLYPQARHMLVAHNVIDGGAPSTRGGVLFGGDTDSASTDNVVEYNVIAYAHTYGIDSWWGGQTGSGNVARRNCLWRAGRGNVNTAGGGFAARANTIVDPLFVDRRRRDYRLSPDSPCRQTVVFDAAAQLRKP
jgi:hypothetical protein